MRLVLNILWMILVFIGAAFAVLNSQSLTINYFFGQKTIPFSLIMLLILILGALIAIVFLLPGLIRNKIRILELKSKAHKLEKACAAYESQVTQHTEESTRV